MNQCSVARAPVRKGWWLRLLRKQVPPVLAPASAPREPVDSIAPCSPSVQWQPSIDVDLAFCRWLFADTSDGSGGDAQREAALLGSFESKSLERGRASALVPRVPTVVPQLLRTLRDPAGSVRELSRHVAQDPTVVAAVLEVANSAHFRPARPIASIEQALLVLGHDTLRQIIARIAFKPILNVRSAGATARAAPLIWQQAERCGVACHVLAPAFGASGFEAFLGALVQNAGIIVAIRVLDNASSEPWHACSDGFYVALMAHARRLACDIAEHWSFPAAVIDAMAKQEREALRSSPSALALLLHTCDELSKARLLLEAKQVVPDDLALHDARLIACFERLAEPTAG